jgi:hypothetical protein
MNKTKRTRWIPVILPMISAVLGFIAGPVIETAYPDFFKGINLLYTVFVLSGILFLFIGMFVIDLGSLITSQNDKIQEGISGIASSLDVRFTYIPVGKGNARESYRQVGKLLRRTKNEMLVLNYGVARHFSDQTSYDKSVAQSSERRSYYQILSQKVSRGASQKFRFRRIVQIPADVELSGLPDELMLEHFQEMIEVSNRMPEYVSIKTARTYFNGTFLVLDGRYLVHVIEMSDPEDKEHYTKGFYLFDDPKGEFIRQFVSLFDRIDAYATLLTSL